MRSLYSLMEFSVLITFTPALACNIARRRAGGPLSVRQQHNFHAIAPVLVRNGSVDFGHGVSADQPVEGKVPCLIERDHFRNKCVRVAVAFDDALHGVTEGDSGKKIAGHRRSRRWHTHDTERAVWAETSHRCLQNGRDASGVKSIIHT